VPPIELVIFDNDGVVVDSEVLANRVLAELLAEHGYPASAEECIRDFLGGTLANVRSTVRDRAGIDLPAAFDHEYHRKLFYAFAELSAVPGIEMVLRSLEYPYCLASSGTMERITRSLETTKLLGYFEGRIFSADHVEKGKPAPDLFSYAAETMGARPRACVVVEDSPNGVAAAKAAGMMVAGYTAVTPPERLAGADVTFSDMLALPGLLADLAR